MIYIKKQRGYMRIKAMTSLLTCALLVTGCGGSGSNAGGTTTKVPDNGTTNPGNSSSGWNVSDVNNYFPLEKNFTWTYWESKNSTGEITKTKLFQVKLSNIESTSTATSATLQERINIDFVTNENKIQKTADGLKALVKTVPWLNELEMVLDIDFSAKQGNPWTSFKKTGIEYLYDIDRDEKKETANIDQTSILEGYEDISTEAGDFKLAAKISTKNTLTIITTKDGVVSSYIATRIRWFAKGIGLIKEIITPDVTYNSSNLIRRELKAYNANGKNVGFGFPFLMQEDVGTRDSDYESVLSQPALASNGTEFFIAATRRSDPYPYYQTISSSLIKNDFSAIGNIPITCRVDCGQPVMVFNTDKFFLVANNGGNISFQRFQANGQAMENASVAIADYGSNFSIRRNNPELATSGRNHLIVYRLYDIFNDNQKPLGIYGAIISPEGQVIKNDILLHAFNSRVPNYSLAYGSGIYLLVFSNNNDESSDVFGIRINIDGVPLDSIPIPISTAPDRQLEPKTVFDGTNFIVVWRDRRNYQSSPTHILPLVTDIYGARVTPKGALLDGDSTSGAILIESSATRKQTPAITFTQKGLVLAWPSGTYSNSESASGIYLKLIDTATSLKTIGSYFVSGVPTDNPSRLGTFYSGVALATNANDLVVSWIDNSVPRDSDKHKRVLGVSAKLDTLPLK